jgi:hypothetical protein
MPRLWMAIGLWYAAWIAYRGPIWANDTATYARWADHLIAHHFNVVAFLRQETFTAPLVLYIIWITLVALAKIAAPVLWPMVLVGINAVSCAATAYAVDSVSKDRIGAIIAAVALACAPDLLLFAPYAISDILFTALSAVAVASLVRAQPGVAWPLTMIATVTRPAAAPLVATAAIRMRPFRPLPMTIVAAIGGMLIVHAYVISAPSTPLPAWLHPWMTVVREGYAEGRVMVSRPAAWSATTMPAILGLTLLKWLAFFSPWVPGYSAIHTLLNVSFFVPLYLGCAYALVKAHDRSAVATLVLYIMLVSGFHAMQELDYDHRYRLPIIPALIMLAALRSQSGADLSKTSAT